MNKVDGIVGCGTAMITPFKHGEVDYNSYKKLLIRQVQSKIDFIVALGTTAETPTLSLNEKRNILEITMEICKDIPVVVGCGTNSVSATLENIREYEHYAPSAFLVVTPYYNKPTQEGLYQYFKLISESTNIPIILYNVPSRTGVNMTSETTIRLSELPNIIGIKEASGNIQQIQNIIKGTKEDFLVFSGNDDQTLELMLAGADGVISVASNIAPKMMRKFIFNINKKDNLRIEDLDRQLQPLFNACFVESNPIPTKMALHIMGYCSSEMRLPLVSASASTTELLESLVNDYE